MVHNRPRSADDLLLPRQQLKFRDSSSITRHPEAIHFDGTIAIRLGKNRSRPLTANIGSYFQPLCLPDAFRMPDDSNTNRIYCAVSESN